MFFSGAGFAPEAAARELWADDFGDRYINFNSSLKSTLLMADQPAPLDGASGTNFWRLRFDLTMVPEPWLETEISYENRMTLQTGVTSVADGGRFLPQSGDLPYRVIPLASAVIDEAGLNYEQGLDRLALGVRGDWGQLKVGRQAIGFGRSQFFTAVDVLAPFGTFQVDQEWKAGVDAVDAQFQIADTASIGITGAAEHDFEDGAILGRAQGYLGDADALLIGGKRSEDGMLGMAVSGQIFDAAINGELAFFGTDGRGFDQAQIGDTWIIKGGLGGSYTFDLLGGLTTGLEYHFNGFGLVDVRADASTLADADWQARFQRGDFQTIGQHELATNFSLVIDEYVTGTGYAVMSARDGSGMAGLGAVWNYSNNLSLDGNVFVPWGAGASAVNGLPALGSEYGIGGTTVYIGIRVYD